jgi:hypothetical protein
MANELQFYDAAKAALAKAKRVDEVKKIHNKAAAMKAAAKIAKDKDLEADAHEIRMRAERRLGELMGEQKEKHGLNKGGRPTKTAIPENAVSKPATLAEAGIDTNLAHRARTAAKPSEQEFEMNIAAAKEQIVKLNIVHAPVRKPKQVPLPDLTVECVTKVRIVIEGTLALWRHSDSGEQKIRFLFQSLHDELRAIEAKTLPPKSVEESVEERRAANAKLAESTDE